MTARSMSPPWLASPRAIDPKTITDVPSGGAESRDTPRVQLTRIARGTVESPVRCATEAASI